MFGSDTIKVTALTGAIDVENFQQYRRRDGVNCGRSRYRPLKRHGLVVEIGHFLTALDVTAGWEDVRRQRLLIHATAGGEKIGFLDLRRVRCDAAFRHAHIWDTYASEVEISYRHLGIASAMYGHVKQLGLHVALAFAHSPDGKELWTKLAADLLAGGCLGQLHPKDDRSNTALKCIVDDSSPYQGLREAQYKDSYHFLDLPGVAPLMEIVALRADCLVRSSFKGEKLREYLSGVFLRTRFNNPADFLGDEDGRLLLSLKTKLRLCLFGANGFFNGNVQAFLSSWEAFALKAKEGFDADQDEALGLRRCRTCERRDGCYARDGRLEAKTARER